MATSTDSTSEALVCHLDDEGDFGEPTRTQHATDASSYEGKPAGVVAPANREALRLVVEELASKLDALNPDVVATTGAACSQQVADLGCETVHPLVLFAAVVE